MIPQHTSVCFSKLVDDPNLINNLKKLPGVTIVDDIVDMDPNAQHQVFIVPSGELKKRSMAFMHAINLGASVATVDWVTACCAARKIIAIGKKEHVPCFSKEKEKAWGTTCFKLLNLDRKNIKVFQGFYIYCDPRILDDDLTATAPNLPRIAFRNMIRAGGGELLEAPPIDEQQQRDCFVISRQELVTPGDEINELIALSSNGLGAGAIFGSEFLFNAVITQKLGDLANSKHALELPAEDKKRKKTKAAAAGGEKKAKTEK